VPVADLNETSYAYGFDEELGASLNSRHPICVTFFHVKCKYVSNNVPIMTYDKLLDLTP